MNNTDINKLLKQFRDTVPNGYSQFIQKATGLNSVQVSIIINEKPPITKEFLTAIGAYLDWYKALLKEKQSIQAKDKTNIAKYLNKKDQQFGKALKKKKVPIWLLKGIRDYYKSKVSQADTFNNLRSQSKLS